MMFDYVRELHSQISKSFEKHSSPIDWCEANYGVTPEVAEFYNTISNGVFLVLPPILIYLFGQFGRQHSRKVQFIWLLMIGIGAASAYFHATLSLAGQLMDEFGILWVFNATLAFWLPRQFLQKILKDDDRRFEMLTLLATLTLTILGCFWPILNSFVLMCCSVPAAMILRYEIKRCKDDRARFMAKRSIVIWVIAVCVWLSDRFVCGVWQQARLPGGHWLWHILVAYCCYQAIVFLCFTDAVKNVTVARPPTGIPVLAEG